MGAYYLEAPGARLGIILCHAYTGSTADVRPQAAIESSRLRSTLGPFIHRSWKRQISKIFRCWSRDLVAGFAKALAFMKERYDKCPTRSTAGRHGRARLSEADSQLVGGASLIRQCDSRWPTARKMGHALPANWQKSEAICLPICRRKKQCGLPTGNR